MTQVRWIRLAVVLLLILVVYFVVPVETTASSENVVRAAGALLGFVSLAGLMVRQLRMHLDDASRRVDGLVIGIVLIVVVFAYAFYSMNRHDPSQFAGLKTRLDSLYFAVTTLATVGTGDVHAAGQAARALVLVQMVFNVLFVATTATLLTARIRVAAQIRAEERRAHRDTDHPSG
jgi:voltage-gated potassium channel